MGSCLPLSTKVGMPLNASILCVNSACFRARNCFLAMGGWSAMSCPKIGSSCPQARRSQREVLGASRFRGILFGASCAYPWWLVFQATSSALLEAPPAFHSERCRAKRDFQRRPFDVRPTPMRPFHLVNAQSHAPTKNRSLQGQQERLAPIYLPSSPLGCATGSVRFRDDRR